MKKTLWSLALLTIMGFSTANADENPSLILGNCRKMTTIYEGTSGTSGSALHYGAETMAAYKGCTISEVCVDLNAASGTDSIRVFVTTSLTGEPLAEQRYTSTKAGWATITFDHPYTVTGEAVYIGYEMQGIKSIRYATAIVPGEEWVRKRSGDWQLYTGDYSASLYAVVTGDVPRRNVCLTHAVLPEYAKAGEPLTLSADLINLGLDTVRTVTVALLANGETVSQQTIDGLRMVNRKQATIDLTGLSLATEGNHALQLAVTAVNDGDDADPSDNASRTVNTLCLNEFTPRKTLMEVFSTERCVNCPTAHALLQRELGDKTDIIEVGHHAGFYTDWLTVDESVAYEWFYRRGNLHAPAVMFDRTSHFDNYPEIYRDTVPVTDVGNLPTLYREATAVPALASLDMQTAYDASSRTLTMSVSGSQLLPIAQADSLRLNVWLTEDSIFSTSQTGASSGFYHRHSLRRSLTSTWGKPYKLDETGTLTFETTLDKTWKAERMEVVAFVANRDATNKYNCRVLNAVALPVGSASTAIAQPSVGSEAVPVARYTLSGLPATVSYKGITIVRMSDGSTQKSLQK